VACQSAIVKVVKIRLGTFWAFRCWHVWRTFWLPHHGLSEVSRSFRENSVLYWHWILAIPAGQHN